MKKINVRAIAAALCEINKAPDLFDDVSISIPDLTINLLPHLHIAPGEPVVFPDRQACLTVARRAAARMEAALKRGVGMDVWEGMRWTPSVPPYLGRLEIWTEKEPVSADPEPVKQIRPTEAPDTVLSEVEWT